VARVYLDEDVSVLLADLLRSRGIDAVTSRDEKMLGKSDQEHFQYARSKKRTIITHNRVDFERIYSSAAEKVIHHYGIICLSRKRDVFETAHRIVLFLAKEKNIENQLWYL